MSPAPAKRCPGCGKAAAEADAACSSCGWKFTASTGGLRLKSDPPASPEPPRQAAAPAPAPPTAAHPGPQAPPQSPRMPEPSPGIFFPETPQPEPGPAPYRPGVRPLPPAGPPPAPARPARTGRFAKIFLLALFGLGVAFLAYKGAAFVLAPRVELRQVLPPGTRLSVVNELLVQNGAGRRAGVVFNFRGGETALFTLTVNEAGEQGVKEAALEFGFQGKRGVRLNRLFQPYGDYEYKGALNDVQVRLKATGTGWDTGILGYGADRTGMLFGKAPGLPYGYVLPGRVTRQGESWSFGEDEIRRHLLLPADEVSGWWKFRFAGRKRGPDGPLCLVSDRYDVTLSGKDMLGPWQVHMKGRGTWTFSETLQIVTGYDGEGELDGHEMVRTAYTLGRIEVHDQKRTRRGAYLWSIRVR